MSQCSGFSNIIFDNFINGILTGLVCLAVEIVSIKIVWELGRAGEDAES